MAFITNIDHLQSSEQLQKATPLGRKITDELIKDIKEMQANYMRTATRHDLLAVKNELKSEMEILKKDIIIKLGTIMAGGVGIIAILIKF